jgi:hypothetical protein
MVRLVHLEVLRDVTYRLETGDSITFSDLRNCGNIREARR